MSENTIMMAEEFAEELINDVEDYWTGDGPNPQSRIAKKIEEYTAQLLASHTDVPPGFALVPIEPTEEMLLIGYDEYRDNFGTYLTRMQLAYTAMLNAAPQPPQSKDRQADNPPYNGPDYCSSWYELAQVLKREIEMYDELYRANTDRQADSGVTGIPATENNKLSLALERISTQSWGTPESWYKEFAQQALSDVKGA